MNREGAFYSKLAIMLYDTLAARQQSRKQCHACVGARPRYCCGFLLIRSCFLMDLYSSGSLLLYDTCTLTQVQRCWCCCCCGCCYCSERFVGSRLWSRVPVPSSVHPFIFLSMLSRDYTVVVLCSVRHAWSVSVFQQSSILCGRGFLRRERHNKDME